MPTPPRAPSSDSSACSPPQIPPLMDAREERALAARARSGDKAARRALAAANLGLVFHVAQRHLGYGLPLADLVQEGSLGLMEAVARYQPRRARFSTYATYWIRAYVLQYVQKNYWMFPAKTRPSRRIFFGLKRERARLEAQGLEDGSAALATALAAALGVSEADVADAQGRFSRPRDFEDPALELAHRDGAPGPDALAEQADLQRAVRRRVAELEPELDDRERTILVRRLMPADGEPETMEEIALRHGLSRQRIEQIERGLRARLRVCLADVRAAA